MSRLAQCLVQRLTHHRPVGEAGQRVEFRQSRNLTLGFALLREVRADPTESEETAALVKNRIARQRPMNILFACRPDDDVGEWKASREMKAQRLSLFQGLGSLVDRQEVRELASEQGLRLAF